MIAATNDRIVKRVRNKGWDYVSIIAGLPGSGKSKFAQLEAKYMCKWFDERYVAWTADKFIEITSKCPPYSAVVLDESFNSLNSKIMYNPEFLRIVNHLQIIRQKYLFIFLCLPNFFDLSKGIAVFRASNLFVTYGNEEDDKGFYMCFGRKEKTELYVLGSKFMNYNARKSNFHGKFPNHQIIPDDIYDKLKKKYTLKQDSRLKINRIERLGERFLKVVEFIWKKKKVPIEEIAYELGMEPKTLKNTLSLFRNKRKEF